MSPRTERQFEEIRQEKKNLIMQTALSLFANEGYHATSISRIAEKAVISKGLMYNYFESKEALLKELFIEASEKIWIYFDPNRDGVLTRDEFFFFIRQSFRVVKENTDYWKLYFLLAMQPQITDVFLDNVNDAFAHYPKMLLEFFTTCGCKDPETELMMLSVLIKGASVQYVSAPQHFSLEAFENKLTEFYKERIEQKC